MVVTLVTLYDDDVRHMVVSHKIRMKFGCVVPAFPLDLQHSHLWVGAGRTKSLMAVGLQGLVCFIVSSCICYEVQKNISENFFVTTRKFLTGCFLYFCPEIES